VHGEDGSLLIAEGLATALSVHMATRMTTLCAFNSGNLEAVAQLARKIHPKRIIVIAADDDRETFEKTGHNPGLNAAESAARAVGGRIAVPPVATDFNDTHAARGLEAVRAALAMAKPLEGGCNVNKKKKGSPKWSGT